MKERDEINILLDDIYDELGKMSAEKRIEWFQKSCYPHPICFSREIAGTVYAVSPHFNHHARESLREKVDRLLKQGG